MTPSSSLSSFPIIIRQTTTIRNKHIFVHLVFGVMFLKSAETMRTNFAIYTDSSIQSNLKSQLQNIIFTLKLLRKCLKDGCSRIEIGVEVGKRLDKWVSLKSFDMNTLSRHQLLSKSTERNNNIHVVHKCRLSFSITYILKKFQTFRITHHLIFRFLSTF